MTYGTIWYGNLERMQNQRISLIYYIRLMALFPTTRVSRYQKKQSPIHIYPDHQSSFIYFPHLLWSIASSLFNLHAWQSFCTTSLKVLSVCHLHFILHTFLQPITVFFIATNENQLSLLNDKQHRHSDAITLSFHPYSFLLCSSPVQSFSPSPNTEPLWTIVLQLTV